MEMIKYHVNAFLAGLKGLLAYISFLSSVVYGMAFD